MLVIQGTTGGTSVQLNSNATIYTTLYVFLILHSTVEFFITLLFEPFYGSTCYMVFIYTNGAYTKPDDRPTRVSPVETTG